MDIYYYLYSEKNDDWFREMMNAFKIKYFKNVVSILDKKYVFITIENDKQNIFSKLVMAGVFINDLPLYAFITIEDKKKAIFNQLAMIGFFVYSLIYEFKPIK